MARFRFIQESIFFIITICLLHCSTENLTCRKGPRYMSCFSDGSGYTEYRCNKSSELYEEHILRECHTDKTCKCYEHKTSESVMEMCECVNAAKRPKFPSTGVIRWNGTFVLNELSGESKTYVPGEVRKDSQGRFVMKTTSVHDWKQAEEPLKNMEFKIILPDVRTRMFIKYSGDNRSKKCKIEKAKNAGELIEIWQDDPRKYYYLLEETQTVKHIETHVWHQEIPHRGEEWKFTVNYNTKEKYAIPVAYNYTFSRNGFVMKSINLAYTYEPLKDEVEPFKLGNYCANP